MFPSVSLNNYQDHSTFCEGSVVNSLLIFTAAQCVVRKGVGSFYVSLSSTNGTRYTRDVSRAVVHEGYEEGNLDNDVALVVLSQQLSSDIVAQYRVELPRKRSEVPELTTLSGWGVLPYAWGHEIRRRGRLPSLNSLNSDGKRRNILEELFCQGIASDGLCKGYAGAPIYCNTRRSIIQCGVHIYPFDSTSNANASYPTVYTEVMHYLGWIKKKFSCMCQDPESSSCRLKPRCDSNNGDGNYGTMVPIDSPLRAVYRVYTTKKGWTPWVRNGQVAGNPGKDDLIQAIEINLEKDGMIPIVLDYRVYLNNGRWEAWKRAGGLFSSWTWFLIWNQATVDWPTMTAGSTGNNAVSIQDFMVTLQGPMRNNYEVRYEGYLENGGWRTGNGESGLGTKGSIRAIRITTYKKGEEPVLITTPKPPTPDPEDEYLPTVRNHTFRISYISGSPDGVRVDHILGINGNYPGPTIRALPGDIVEVKVINNIQNNQNTTIHWHGVTQAGTPFEDGPSLVTQCPIKAYKTYIYKFPVQQAGTYWYHSHVGSQYTEGMWGALIVHQRPENQLYHWDAEFTITLSEWYHNSALKNEDWFLSRNSSGAPPYPDSGLMNGHGRYNCTYAIQDGRPCNPRDQRRPAFRLRRDETYLLRVINVGGWATYNFTVDGHTLRVIEVDGVEIREPVPTTGVFVGAGQRLGILLEKGPSARNQYFVRAFLRTDDLFFINDGTNINKHPQALREASEITGVFQYTGESKRVTHTLASGVAITELIPEFWMFSYTDEVRRLPNILPLRFVRDEDLQPRDDMKAPDYFDKEFKLEITFVDGEDTEDGIVRGAFNFTSFNYPWGKPLLMKMLEGEPISVGAPVIEVEYGDVVQIVVNNIFNRPHPIHLHGHHFWVVAAGLENAGSYSKGNHLINLDGIRRDTVMVKSRSYAVIRFVADNPGVWSLHCHIDWHNLSGMRTVVASAPKLAKMLYKVTDEVRNVCGDHGIILNNS